MRWWTAGAYKMGYNDGFAAGFEDGREAGREAQKEDDLAAVEELEFLRSEAEGLALSLEALGAGIKFLCTPLGRYRTRYPRRVLGEQEGSDE